MSLKVLSFLGYWALDWKILQFSSIPLLSHVWLFESPWTAAHQASLSITNSLSLLKLMSIKSVIPTNQPSHSLLLPSPPTLNFSQNQSLFQWISSLHQVPKVLELQLQHQCWFPLGWTGLISLLSKGLSRVFPNTTVQKHQFFHAQLSLRSNTHIHTWLLENHSFDYMDLCRQSNVSAF